MIRSAGSGWTRGHELRKSLPAHEGDWRPRASRGNGDAGYGCTRIACDLSPVGPYAWLRPRSAKFNMLTPACVTRAMHDCSKPLTRTRVV